MVKAGFSFSDSDVDELLATADLLLANRMFKLPFPFLCYEGRESIALDGKLGLDGRPDSRFDHNLVVYCVSKLDVAPDFGGNFILVPFINFISNGKRNWNTLDFNIEVYTDPLCPRIVQSPLKFGMDRQNHISLDPLLEREWTIIVWNFVKMMTVLCHTKGSKLEPVVKRKSEKATLLSRDVPVNAHHVIRLYDTHGKRVASGPAGERHRSRMHIRRGHWRNQRYGHRRAHSKPVFIQAQWIGYAEEGIITTEYELEDD
tara:strand:+ start:20023 stop:20799 length:777 start_codon:yes stop_codon:yes gene_type:complete